MISAESVKIRDIIVKDSRLTSMDMQKSPKEEQKQIETNENNLLSRQTAMFSPRDVGGLEEVLSNGTVPQSAVSRPNFTGYEKHRNKVMVK